MNIFIDKFILGLVLGSSFGPVSVAIINYGLKRGFAKTTPIIVGAALGDLAQLSLVFIGLSYLISIPMVKLILFLAGAGVLVYLGYQNIRLFFRNNNLIQGRSRENNNLLLTGLTINLTNPMAIIWWGGIFGSTLVTMTSSAEKLLGLFYGLTIITGIVFWNIFLLSLTHWGNRFIKDKYIRYVSLVSGLMLVFFALKLLSQYRL